MTEHNRHPSLADLGPELPVPEGADPEKAPTASIEQIEHRGVQVSSRYAKHRELVSMCHALDHVAKDRPDLVEAMAEIWCDSQACAFFLVTLKVGLEAHAETLSAALAAAFMEVQSGYNGIAVNDAAGQELSWEDPDWKGDLFDLEDGASLDLAEDASLASVIENGEAVAATLSERLHDRVEMERFLDKIVGKDRWTYDPSGDVWLTLDPEHEGPGRGFLAVRLGGDWTKLILPEATH